MTSWKTVQRRRGDNARDTRVVRGGAWVNTDAYSHCASRHLGVPRWPIDFIGFRLVHVP